MAAIERVLDLATAVVTGGEVGRDRDARALARRAGHDRERRRRLMRDRRPHQAANARGAWSLRREPGREGVERALVAERFDGDAACIVAHLAGDPLFGREAPHPRAKADALHLAAHLDAPAGGGHRASSPTDHR